MITRKFGIELTNSSNESMTLKFKVHDTYTAIKWYYELRRIVTANSDHIKDRDRFYNFPGDKWDEETIIAKLNEHISAINAYIPTINMTAVVGAGRAQFNKLFEYFEMMRGQYDQPAEFFSKAPVEIQAIIDAYNILIYRLINYIQEPAQVKLPRIVVRVQNQKRLPLIDDDFNNFTMDTKFGEVYLNYCETGKHLLDICSNDDNLEKVANIISPQRHFSASFVAKFYESDGVKQTEKFNKWWDSNESRLNSLGYFKGDKTLAIGYLPVAKLISYIPEQELLNQIGKFDNVNRIYFNV